MITYQRERYDEVIEDIKPFLAKHYKEAELYSDRIEFNPDYEVYKAMDEAEALYIYTARDDDILIGYCLSFLQSDPHVQVGFVLNDIFYVDPEYRHTEVAGEMLTRLEEIMKGIGATIMIFNMKTHIPFKSLMDQLEYDQVEYVYSKYIGKEE